MEITRSPDAEVERSDRVIFIIEAVIPRLRRSGRERENQSGTNQEFFHGFSPVLFERLAKDFPFLEPHRFQATLAGTDPLL